MKIRLILAFIASLAATLAPQPGWTQQYPAKPVRLITPYPAGSGTDTFLRALGQELTKAWGQTVVIDNRPGASTIIAAEACAKSAADGYTLCMLDRGTLSTVPHLYRKLPYDPARDFEPITYMNNLVSALAVSANVPANSVTELIALAQAKPGSLNYSSLGEGTPPHLVLEWIKQKFGVNIVHIPFKAPPAIIQSLVAGDVPITYFGLINVLGPIRGGKAKALAVSGDKRSPLLPNVPTLAEAGLQGLDGRVWFGLFAPAGTSRDIVNKVYLEVARIFSVPEFREQRLISQGWEPVASSPEELARFMKADREVAGELVRISGAKLLD